MSVGRDPLINIGSRMLGRLQDRLTYANVTASLALFVALGGTSYAVTALPRGSVGATQLRTNAVTSNKVKDRTLGVRDLSPSARRALRGSAGSAGAAGPQGPTGAPAVRHFAAVSAAGGLVRGDATSGGRAGTTGSYVVGFAEGVSSCAYDATLGTTDGSVVPAGRVTVNDQGGKVGVQTYNAAGDPSDLPFHLVVAC